MCLTNAWPQSSLVLLYMHVSVCNFSTYTRWIVVLSCLMLFLVKGQSASYSHRGTAWLEATLGGGWVNTAKMKVVPLHLVPCGVYARICVWTDSPARPSRCWQGLLHLSAPLTSPGVLCGCWGLCVYASRLDLLCVGLMLKWLTAKQSQGRLRAVVGRERP